MNSPIPLKLFEYFQQARGALNPLLYRDTVENAMKEDLGRGGDLTTESIIPSDSRSSAVISAREAGIVAGLDPALYAFFILDSQMELEIFAQDGERVEKGSLVVRLMGSTKALLTAERTALNILGHLSGIATQTQRMVQLVAHTQAVIADTRKTLPSLRALQKYAVKIGGGRNHRMGLDDTVLIKDNHIAACGSIKAAVEKVRATLGHTVMVEIEVDDLDQLRQVLTLPVDIVLLDNMKPAQLRQAVALSKGRVKLEASGGINENSIREVAECGVDIISLGALTHSVKNFDVGLDL